MLRSKIASFCHAYHHRPGGAVGDPDSRNSSQPAAHEALQLSVKGPAPIHLWYPLAPNSGAQLRLGPRPLPAAERPIRQAALRGTMPFSIEPEPETGIAIATCSGVLQLQEAKEAAAALWKTPGWAGRSAVWDLREAQTEFSRSDTRRFAQFILDNQPETAPSRVAFVTHRDADFGMARMFEVFREDPRTAFRVFRDYDEAISWAQSVEPGAAWRLEPL
jgi:hypothetical protein